MQTSRKTAKRAPSPLMKELPPVSLRRNDPVQAMELTRAILQKAYAQRDNLLAANCLRILSNCSTSLGDFEAARGYLEQAYTLLPRIQDIELKIMILTADAILSGRMGEYDRELEKCKESLELARKVQEVPRQVVALINLGVANMNRGDYVEALNNYFEALALSEPLEDKKYQAGALANIGLIYLRLMDYDRALEYNLRALKLVEMTDDKQAKAQILGGLGQAYLHVNKTEEARTYFEAELVLAEELSSISAKAIALSGIGKVHEANGDSATSLQLQQEAIELLKQHDEKPYRIELLTSVGGILLSLGKYSEAEEYLNMAFSLIEEGDFANARPDAYLQLSKLRAAQQNYEEAYKYFSLHVELRDKRMGYLKQQEIAHLQVQAERRVAERENELLKVRAEQLEQQMMYKTKELANLTTNLVQRHEYLDKIFDRVKSIRSEADKALDSTTIADIRKQIGSNQAAKAKVDSVLIGTLDSINTITAGLLDDIDIILNDKDEWETFERQFEQTHQGFITTLANQFPTLTPTEIKICSLLRLNLSTKDIARILCISNGTVDGHRFNIRRKLSLAPDANLTTYLASLS